MRGPVFQSQIPVLAALDRTARKALVRRYEERDALLRRYRRLGGWVFSLFFAIVFIGSRTAVSLLSSQAIWWMGGKVCAQLLCGFLLVGVGAAILRLFFVNPRLQTLLRD